jgi:putative endopeptidase
MFLLSGMSKPDAELQSKNVMELETQIAAVSLKMVERRDPVKTYNKRTLAEIKTIATNIEFDTVFGGLAIANFGDIIVESPLYFEKLSTILGNTEVGLIKSYLRYHILKSAAPFISEEFEMEHFNFFKKILNGIEAMEPRWKRVLSVVSNHLSDPISQIYVEKHFSPQAKKAAFDMVQYIIEGFLLITVAFKEAIQQASWMQEVTKKKALEKLSKFNVKIGFPDKWKDFSPLDSKISRQSSYLANIRVASEFVYKIDELDTLNRGVDKTKWEMAPFMVNAYFHPTMNEIVFPAVIFI